MPSVPVRHPPLLAFPRHYEMWRQGLRKVVHLEELPHLGNQVHVPVQVEHD